MVSQRTALAITQRWKDALSGHKLSLLGEEPMIGPGLNFL